MKRRLLYLCPVIPATGGNGLAMRAGAVLRALAVHYDVSLLVLSLYTSVTSAIPDTFASLCARSTVWYDLRSAPSWVTAERFDAMHVFRLATVPYAAMLFRSGISPVLHLDMDDLESRTLERLAALHTAHGHGTAAVALRAEAAAAALLERQVCAEYARVYLAAQEDQVLLREHGGAWVEVLPNVVPCPAPLPLPDSRTPFVLLFLATLSYYPNDDAVQWFCTQVLPVLRGSAPCRFRLDIAGMGASATVQTLARYVPEVRLIGPVVDSETAYAGAHAVVVPLRAGGGTRIKVLEAFAYRRPVISTTIGAEGIAAVHGEHLLCADTAEGFARCCDRVMADTALSSDLAGAAHALYRQRYTPAALVAVLAPE